MKILTLLTLLCLAAAQGSAANPTPNVVFIITDDQSWDSIGFTGGEVHTPRLDRMAKEGLYFPEFHVTSTVCSPSRYSFLTGRYAGNSQGERFMREHPPGDQTQIENIGELEPERWNLAKALQKSGYRTGFVGKSHLINHEWVSESGSNERGWKKAGLELYAKDADPRDPEVNAKMRSNHEKWCEAMKPYGFDYVDAYYAANLRELFNESLGVHNLDWTVDRALRFIEDSQDEPFFLYLSTTLHHGPSPWVNKYSLEADPRMTSAGFFEEGFDVLPSRKNVLQRNRAAGFRDRDAYALWLDDGVGAILDKLTALGLEEDTLVIFVPDHGSYRHGKATLHDYGMRVPLLMRWKGTIAPGSSYDGLVANIDIAPTLLAVCGIEVPSDYAIDGLSFEAQLHGAQTPLREVLYAELGHSRAIKTKDWKYIAVRYPEELQKRVDAGETFRGFQGEILDRPYLTRNGHLGHHASKANPHYFEPDQLYYLTADPEENDNVFAEHPEIAEQMAKQLATALKQFKDRPYGEFTE